jgi:Uma2 family endonuclease
MLKPGRKSYSIQKADNNYRLLPQRSCCEILDGKRFPQSVPAIKHQAVILKIASALLRYAESHKLGLVLQGPCDVILSGTIVIQPDILFVKNERRGLIGERSLRGIPDLVVEVLSPDTRERDLKAKKRIYSRYEIQEYWVVDPDARTVDTLIWSELGYISARRYRPSEAVSTPMLPALDLPLSGVFDTC